MSNYWVDSLLRAGDSPAGYLPHMDQAPLPACKLGLGDRLETRGEKCSVNGWKGVNDCYGLVVHIFHNPHLYERF